MNQYFDTDKIAAIYPGAEDLMIPAMLIWKLPPNKEYMKSQVCESGEYFGEEKIDGVLFQFVKGAQGQNYLFGRTVSKINGLLTEKGSNVPHITSALDCLPNNTILIGEIYYPGKTAKDCVTIMGCLPQVAIKRQNDKEYGLIRYYIHDVIFYNGVSLINEKAWNRYRVLKAIWKKFNLEKYDFLRLAVAVENNIEQALSDILSSGGEGMVLKKKDAVYVPSKRPAWAAIKFKQMDTADLVCTRAIEATKEYTGIEEDIWPYWENIETGEISIGCKYGQEGWQPVTKPYALGWATAIGIGGYNSDGKLVEIGTVSSGLTDNDRENLGIRPGEYIGRVVTLDCMSLDNKERTLRHPAFRGWRTDKNAEECKLDDIFAE